MANRELNALEKAFVVRQLCGVGALQKETDELRADQEVMEKVFRCSPWRIAGLKAEFTKRMQRRLKQPDLLGKRDVVFVRSYVGLAGSQREHELLQGEVADLLRIDTDTVQRITEDTRKESRIALEGIDVPIHGEFPLATLEPVPLLQGGTHTDYHTPERENLRAVWARAIDESIPRTIRSRIFGLILPGKRCLDVPHYLALGVTPKHLIALEHGGDVEPRLAKAEFVLAARRHDIDYHTDDLSDFLPTLRQRIDFAVLDFTGQMCPKYLDIAANLPLSERAVVIFNTWARRECGEHQNELRRMWQHMGLPPEQFSLEHARGLCLGLINAGAGRKENWYFGSRLMESLPLTREVINLAIKHPRARVEKNLETVLAPLLSSMIDVVNAHGLLRGGTQSSDVCEGLVRLIQDMFKDVCFSDAYIEQLRKHWYKSEIIKDSPFHVDIGVILTPKYLYHEKLSNAVDFLMSCARRYLTLLEQEEGETDIPTSRMKFAVMRGGHFIKVGEATRRDRLACLLDGKLIDYRSAHVLLNALEKYHSFRERCTYDKWEKQMEVERVEIV